MTRRAPRPWFRLAALALLAALASREAIVHAVDPVDEGCPATSPPESHTGTTLKGYAESADSSGVVYSSGSGGSLSLTKEGGTFASTFFPVTGNVQYTCAGDFDEDGYMDFAGSDAAGQKMGIYINNSDDNLPASPDWNNSAFKLTPKFTLKSNTYFYTSATDNGGGGVTACADFNNDGNVDFAIVLEKGDDKGPAVFGKVFLGNGNGTVQAGYDISTDVANHFYDIGWDGNMVPTDYNGDGRIDLLFGDAQTTGGTVQVFLNNGATPPRFVPDAFLVTNAGLGTRGINGLAWEDFTNDGRKDLGISGDSSSTIKIYPGLEGGGVSVASVQTFTTATAGPTLLLGADYSLDGKIDLIIATNGNSGRVWYYKNNGTGTPFSSGLTSTLSETFDDFDTGFWFDYDNDPDHTPDLMLADGNGAGYSTFANRFTVTYVSCGNVQSGVLDLGDVEDEEMVVTAARLSPTVTLPSGTTVTYYMSNEDPADWQLASTCTDDVTDYCVSFPDPVGRSVRWKALMCSNSGRTQTPVITAMSMTFDYTPAEEHYRAGVVVDDGVAYVGAFRQPGDRGHFYALDANLSQTYWDAGAKLDAMADTSRHIYTATSTGDSRLNFTTSAASGDPLQTTLGVANTAAAQTVITWQRSARFGLGGTFDPTKLGSVELSSPAVLSPPERPSWYTYADGTTRALIDDFVDDQDDRPVLVLFGSKDGPLHAIRNTPSNISSSANGVESWAFIPAKVAFGLNSDRTTDTNTAYVDGSPTLADVVFSDGEMHTVAVVGRGKGGRSVFALDVTDTVNRTNGNIIGPTPLWEVIPGDSTAGLGTTKPAIGRVRISGTQRFIAVLASGMASENPNAPWEKGRDVIAVDVETGEQLWRFKAACPVTSDLVLFETGDANEPGAPAIDGYVDRLVFADYCGNLYKLDPAVELEGTDPEDGWVDSTDMGDIDTGTVDGAGRAVMALFSTSEGNVDDGAPTGTLGEERPISGTIGAREDSTGRVVLYLGTGGIESFDPAEGNAFYAIYADDGGIRDTIAGACGADGCEKFYGGVVVSSEQVFLTRAIDPPVGTATCDLGESLIAGFDADTLSGGFSVATDTASVSALFGHAGAIYLTTLGGAVVRIGTPTAGSAGGESASEEENTTTVGNTGALHLFGWRQVL